MKRFFYILGLLLLHSISFGQNYLSDFKKVLQDGDTIKQFEILQKWEAEDPKNPDLFASYFNYYYHLSKNEMITLTMQKAKGESFELQDSSGQTSYLGNEVVYKKEVLQKGFDKIDEGILLYPDRLDLRFGKIYVLGLVEDWDNYTAEIIKTVRYSKINNNRWKWINNVEKEDGEKFFLGSMQEYQLTLYETKKDELLIHMRSIADEILKIYPKHVESLTNIAISYILKSDYEKGLEALLKAEKIDPKDGIVLGNIAYLYVLKGDDQKSIEYYEKMLLLEDPEAVEFAKQQILDIKNK